MRELVTKLARYLQKGGEIEAEATEERIGESFEGAIEEEEHFFSLPTNEIVKIIVYFFK